MGLGARVLIRSSSACENLRFLPQKSGQGCGIAGVGLWESPPTRVFGRRVLGALGLGPRGLILEFEDIRKHTLFALENGQGCGIAGIGAAGSRLQHVFLGFVFWAGLI